MPLKRHHKIIIGSFTTIVIAFMVVTSILLNGIIVNQNLNQKELSNEINNLQADTQSKLNDLTESLMKTQNDIKSLNTQVGSIDEEFALLKASASSDFSSIIENSIKSVVTVRTDVGQGTGFIITNDGYIVTNAHVLSGGKTVYVLDYEQQKLNTIFIGYNADLDIALLKVSGNYNPLELGNSDEVQIGEKVIAIGNPLGLQFSVTEGIVSGVHREGINGLEDYIQTDASLNPGNSGGPLINTEGKVIGINNFKISGTESLGFALESNYIKDTVNQIGIDVLGKELI